MVSFDINLSLILNADVVSNDRLESALLTELLNMFQMCCVLETINIRLHHAFIIFLPKRNILLLSALRSRFITNKNKSMVSCLTHGSLKQAEKIQSICYTFETICLIINRRDVLL